MRPTARRLAGVLTAILLIFAALPASAWQVERPEARFDDRVVPRAGGVIATAPRPLAQLDPGDPLRVGWEAFGRARGGGWNTYIDERSGLPTMVSGPGLRWFPDTLSDASAVEPTLDQLESRARDFLQENEALLGGGWAGLLELDSLASGSSRPGSRRLVFRQAVDGIRVENARFDFHVSRGKLVLFGASNWARPRIDGRPQLDAAAARAVLDAHLGEPSAAFEQARVPQLTIRALDRAPSSRPRAWQGARGLGLRHALLWRFQFRVPGEVALWIGEIDAHSGELIAFYDGAHYTAVRGGVFPIAPDGDCAGGGCEIDGFPMPLADFTEAGQATQYSDTFGNLACADPEATYTTSLAGQFVRIDDTCGAISETVVCGQPLELGLKTGESCDVPLGNSPGNTAAARAAFYQINRAIEIGKHYLPGNTWLDAQVTVNTNINNTCNASWGGEINMFREGNGCGNTGENQGVLVHEWGHGLDQNDGGGYDNTSEAYADVVGIFAARDSCMGRGFFNDGSTCSGYGDTCLTCTGIRDHDFAARQENTPATPQDFVQNRCGDTGNGPCGGQTHCEAYPIAESIYDFAARDLPAMGLDPDSAWQLAERLWYETRDGSGGPIYTCALPDSDSCDAGSWYQRMRVADDDDADLSNGTPHAAALFAAFDRHNIACGEAADATNQNTSACPALATPAINVTETVAGTQLSWGAIAGADDYLIFRGETGCNRQQVVIGTVPAGQTSFVDAVSDAGLPRYYRVQARDANPTCRSAVSNCVGSPGGARLQKNAHRVDDSGANGNDNGLLEPGETVQLPVTLFNSGLGDAFDVGGGLRVVEGLKGRVLDVDADWNDLPVNTEDESLAPHFELTVFESVACGDSIELELDMQATGAGVSQRRFGIQFGTPDRDFTSSSSVSIPPQTTEPVLSTIDVTQDRTLSELDVSIDINHTDDTALIVELTSPQGTTVRLHNRSSVPGFGLDVRYDQDRQPDGPGTMADFVGESTLGSWTLAVEDVDGGLGVPGTLVSWTLHTTVQEVYDCTQQTCGEPTPSSEVSGFTVDENGSDLLFDWDALSGVTGYHVLQAVEAPFDGVVELTGRTDAVTTTLTAVDGINSTPDLTYFLVRGVNGCNQEGP